MRSGSLLHRVKFFAKVTSRNDYNASVDSYPIATIETRGEIRYIGGNKALSNEEITFTKSIELTVRYRSDINESMRIQIDGTLDFYFITYLEIIGKKEGIRLTIEKIGDQLSGTLIEAPSLLSAVTDGIIVTTINLTWLNNANDNAVVIERSTNGNNWAEIHRTIEAVESYSDEDLPEVTRFYYRIRAFVYKDYSSYTNVEIATTGTED